MRLCNSSAEAGVEWLVREASFERGEELPALYLALHA